LRERGIGIQHVFDEWRTIAPDYPTILFDESTARTPRQATKLMEEFYNTRAAVLIGSNLALPYLTTPVTTSAIISFDATRAIPSWRADEMVFRLLLDLREKSTQEVLLQTRQPTDDLLTYASRGALERFYDDELLLRSQLHYPPHTRLILLTWIQAPATAAFSRDVQATYAQFEPHCYRSPNSQADHVVMHALFRISTDDMTQYAALLTQLRQLPPFVKVEIDPDRIV
jgi:primosomal protein N' (replication factor Y)